MKKITLIFLSLFLLQACTLPAPQPLALDSDTEQAAPANNSAPLPTPTPPGFEIVPNPVLTRVEMLDSKKGWAQAEDLVLRTEDGGETWLDITPKDILNDPAYAPAAYLTEDVAWLLIEDVDKPNVGMVFYTEDGGANWLWGNTPFGNADFGFIDAENGYAMMSIGAAAGSMGVSIWKSTNGGVDFNRVYIHEPGFDDSLPFSGMKNGISFLDAQRGWVAGAIPQDAFIWLYRTMDGGFSWALQEVSMPAGFEQYQTSTDAPRFFDGGLGLLPVHLRGEELGLVFYRTTDGGETWTETSPLLSRGSYALISINEIIVWDGGETFYFTENAGETWDSTSTNWQPYDALTALDFVSLQEGWALADGSLYVTKNGGAVWEKTGE